MTPAILAAEEETFSRALLVDILQNSGYNVLKARGGTGGAASALEHGTNLVVLE